MGRDEINHVAFLLKLIASDYSKVVLIKKRRREMESRLRVGGEWSLAHENN